MFSDVQKMRSMASALVFVGFLGFLALPKANSQDFARDLRDFRLDLIKACSQLQAGEPAVGKAELLAEIDALLVEWQRLDAAYRERPPAAYASDTAWAGYFEEAIDNLRIMRERAEAERYRRAARFCGMNCRLFVNINEVNGIDRTSDRLFHVRMTTRQMMERVRASNWEGAARLLDRAQRHIDHIGAHPAADAGDREQFQADLAAIRSALAPVADAVANRDAARAGDHFGPYLRKFREVYVRYL